MVGKLHCSGQSLSAGEAVSLVAADFEGLLMARRTKAQGERLLRQLLQHLLRYEAHPSLVADAAVELADLLLDQGHFEEAEQELSRARKVHCCDCATVVIVCS